MPPDSPTVLGDLCFFVKETCDCSFADSDTYVSTESMLPNIAGITASGSIPLTGLVNKYRQKDILISNIRPYFKKIWQSDRCGTCSNDVLVLRAKDERISDYLFALLSEDCFFDYVMLGSKGTKMPRGDKNQILTYPINKQTFSEMLAIGNFISLIKRKITCNQAINDNLEAQISALFSKTIESSNRNTIRFGSLIKIGSGGTPKTSIGEYWSGEIPFLSPKDIDGVYTYSTEKYLTKLGLDNCNSGHYPKNTTIITARGTVGKITLVARDMAMNQSCYAIMARNKGQEHYIHQLSLYAADSIKQKSNGAVFDAINAKDITEESVPDITTYDIISFEREVTPLYDMIWENGKEIRSLSAIRDYLLPKLMSGEIDVSTLKIPTKYSFTPSNK